MSDQLEFHIGECDIIEYNCEKANGEPFGFVIIDVGMSKDDPDFIDNAILNDPNEPGNKIISKKHLDDQVNIYRVSLDQPLIDTKGNEMFGDIIMSPQPLAIDDIIERYKDQGVNLVEILRGTGA